MTKKTNYIIIGIIAVVVITLLIIPSGKSYDAVENFEGEITIHKSSSCGCCGLYGAYFQREGNSDANILNSENVESIKDQYNIPLGLRSCHTTVIGDYFVEGHIPLEAIEKLLQEKPNISGIAMSGMPAGSPGMPGSKTQDFVIYAVDHDGNYEEFVRL